MHDSPVRELTVCATGILGGLYLFVAPFTRMGEQAPRWVRRAFWLAAPFLVVGGFINLMLALETPNHSSVQHWALGYLKQFSLGVGIGAILVPLISGEFIPALSKKSRPDASALPVAAATFRAE